MLCYTKDCKSRPLIMVITQGGNSYVQTLNEIESWRALLISNLNLISIEHISFSSLTLEAEIKGQNLLFEGLQKKALYSSRALSHANTESYHRACYDFFI